MKIKSIKSIPVLFTLLILILIMQQTLKVGGNSILSSGIHNSAHGPWFALVTYLIWCIVSATFRCRLNFIVKLSLTVMIAVLIAFMSEFGEKIIGRVASWEDFFLDMCGMVSVILFILSCKTRNRKRLGKQNSVLFTFAWLILFFSLYPFFFAAAITLHHKNIQPRLLGFDWYLDYASMSTDGEARLMAAPKTWFKFAGQQVMRLTLPNTRWPGFKLRIFTSNWRPYSYLVVEIFNDSTESLPLKISIRPDSQTDDGTIGFGQRMELVPGENTLRISIDDLLPDREKIEWRVRMIIGFTPRSFAGRTIFLREIRLE